MRKLYNSEVAEERNATLTFEVGELRKEIENEKQTLHDATVNTLEERLDAISSENREFKVKCQQLQNENIELNSECETVKNKFGEVSSKLFTAELEMDKAKKEDSYLQTLE